MIRNFESGKYRLYWRRKDFGTGTRRGPYLIGLAALLLGCGAPDEPELPVEPVPEIPLSVLRSAPDSLVVLGLPVSIRVEAGRDFMPTVPPRPDGGPLGVFVSLLVPGRDDFPSLVDDVYMWAIHGDRVWSKVMLRRDWWPPEELAFASGSGGPRWGPDVTIDVALAVRDSTGQLSLVIVKNVLIKEYS